MPLVSRWGSEVLTTGAFEPDTNKPRPITLGLGSKPVPIDLLGKTDVLGTFVERTRVSSRGSWVERPKPLKGRGGSGGLSEDTSPESPDPNPGHQAPLAGPSGLEAAVPAPLAGPSGLSLALDNSDQQDPQATDLKFFSALISDGGDGFAPELRDNEAGRIKVDLGYTTSSDTVSYPDARYLRINSVIDGSALISLDSNTFGTDSYMDQRGKLSGHARITLNASVNPGFEFSKWEVKNNFASEDAPAPSYGTLEIVSGDVNNPHNLIVEFPLDWDSLSAAVEVKAVYKKVTGYSTNGTMCFPVYYPDLQAPFSSLAQCEANLTNQEPPATNTETIQVFTNTDKDLSDAGYTGGTFEVTNFSDFSSDQGLQGYTYDFNPSEGSTTLMIRAEDTNVHGFTYQSYEVTGDDNNYVVDDVFDNGLQITFTGGANVELIFI